MKNFHFPLHSVLVYRERLKEDERSRLQILLNQEAEIARRRAEIQQQLHAGFDGVSVDASELHRMAEYRKHLRNLDADLHREAESCRKNVVEQRAKCLHAQRQHKILEKLKASRYADWKRAAERDEELQAAETFSASWLRSKRS